MYSLNICHLYPDLLNLHGDRGNIITLQKRCLWRGIDVELHDITQDNPFQSDQCDILFIGGGQDFEQEIILTDLKENKYPDLKSFVEGNGTVLAICGGYQMLGQYYKTKDDKMVEMLNLIDVKTIDSKNRLVGNLIFEWENDSNSTTYNIVGFENHSGLTYLGENTDPLGKVVKGFGNNGQDGYEGARYKNVFCSYSHGSLLPKNPHLADYIITCALKRKYPDAPDLIELDDRYELAANQSMLLRLMK